MIIPRITEAEMAAKGVASLPTRPNNPYAYGGENLTATELKERFDRLPRHIAERLNLLLSAIAATPYLEDLSGGSLAEMLPTGMFPGAREGHTLASLFADILDGTLSTYLRAGTATLAETLDGKENAPVIVTDAAPVLMPRSGHEYRLGTPSSLSISLPDLPEPDFSALLVFQSGAGNGDTSIDYPDGILWSGDDIVSGRFLPFGGRHYTVLLWYDGAWHGAVRGVAV